MYHLVLELQVCASSVFYNNQCSLQTTHTLPNIHPPLTPSLSHPATLSLFSIIKSLLWFVSISGFILRNYSSFRKDSLLSYLSTKLSYLPLCCYTVHISILVYFIMLELTFVTILHFVFIGYCKLLKGRHSALFTFLFHSSWCYLQ